MPLDWRAWLGPMRREYLESFIPEGGGAVRFVVAEGARLPELAAELAEAAEAAGLAVIPIDTAATRLHMLQAVFFAIARSLDWDALTQQRLERLVADAGYAWAAPGQRMTIDELAAGNAVVPALLRRTLQQQITRAVWDDAALAQDFRSAMITLLNVRLTQDQEWVGEGVLDWLRGDLRRLGAVREAQIGARIGRQNARAMLVSLFHWLRGCGHPGLLVLLDLRQLLLERREAGEGLYYSPAAVMDCYEVLRQVIDDAEHHEGFMLVAFCDPRLVNDDVPRRALGQYTALKMRVWDDVRSQGGDNPLSPLVLVA